MMEECLRGVLGAQRHEQARGRMVRDPKWPQSSSVPQPHGKDGNRVHTHPIGA